MERGSSDCCRILFCTENNSSRIRFSRIFEEIPDPSLFLHFQSPQNVLETMGSETKSSDVFILDTHEDDVWRRVLACVHAVTPAPAVVLLTEREDREFDRDALRLGAADSAVIGRLTPYALERIIRQAFFRRQVSREIQEREADLLIQERLAAVGMLASGMAHEIGTPLGVIRGRAEVLLLRNQLNEGVRRDLGIIIEQSDRIARLMRSLLNLARGDDLKSSQSVDLACVVEDVLGIMGQVLRLEGIEVIREIPSNLPLKVHAESEPFHQILLNLIQNALHAIETEKKTGRKSGHTISVSVYQAGTDWCMEIADSGCGMSQEVIRNLFRPFFTTKGIGQGVGLGLSLSYRILESWRGSISVESKIGTGSVFKIMIPRA
ncbi:MAG: HAMP domain-containing histidine kinase [Bdellovibrionales bacterium]|nr:HAMP domain-containing histidine kinase [Bdellovibrionales bacterium]